MSTEAFQNALAQLIRLPESNREDATTAFLKDFDLTDSEHGQLIKLAADPAVTKYGRIMRGVRFSSYLRQAKMIPNIVEHQLLERICLRLFEPTACFIRAREYPVEFTRFLHKNERARELIAENAPEWVFDLIRFEEEQLIFRRQLLDHTCPLPGDTLLRHRCFRVVTLEWDIPSLTRKVSSTPDSKLADFTPEKTPQTLLMLGDLEIPKFKTFAIDEDTAKFLVSQEAAYAGGYPLPADVMPPASYQDLVDVGLCKPLPKH